MAAAVLAPFEAQPVPPTELMGRDRIMFAHPGYPEPANILLILPRVDRGAASDIIGIHHETALLACQIIADNAFETGRLTVDKEGQHPVDVPLDGILAEKVYYFVVGDGPSKYPVVPSFRDWEFPHDRIPKSWPCVSPSGDGPADRCGITNFSFCTEEMHLVPADEEDWFCRNGMWRYGLEFVRGIDDEANIFRVVPSILKSLDKGWLLIAPKAAGTYPSPQYVSHILSAEAAELWPAYHNTLVQYLHRASRPYLFARFAWAVILRVKPFIINNFSRHVVRTHFNPQNGALERKLEYLSGSQLGTYYGPTPKKRKSDDGDSLVEDDIDSDDTTGSGDVMDDWEDRGDKRQKMSWEETAVDEDNQTLLLEEFKERFLQGLSALPAEPEEEDEPI